MRRIEAALAVLLFATTACGEDVVLGDGRSPRDAAAPRDTGQPDPDALEFSEPLAIEALAAPDATDDDPSLSADLRLLYFNSEREGGAGQEDIWFAMRDSPAETWQAPRAVDELNTEERETGIALASDGLAIWWSSDRPDGEGGLDVYTATRANRDAAWSAITRVEELSSAGDDLISAVTDAAQTVLLARRESADADYDLFIARRSDAARAFADPEPLAELNSDEEESDAFLLAGGLQLLFTRDEDLQLARRAREGGPFEAPQALEALNSDADDRDAWAADDFGYVVFSSDRSGAYLLYEASR